MNRTQDIIIRLKEGRVNLRLPRGKFEITAYDKEGNVSQDYYERPYYLNEYHDVSVGFDFWKNKRSEF